MHVRGSGWGGVYGWMPAPSAGEGGGGIAQESQRRVRRRVSIVLSTTSAKSSPVRRSKERRQAGGAGSDTGMAPHVRERNAFVRAFCCEMGDGAGPRRAHLRCIVQRMLSQSDEL